MIRNAGGNVQGKGQNNFPKGVPKANKRNLEIHDFHETWLKNMELYQDKSTTQYLSSHRLPNSTFGVKKSISNSNYKQTHSLPSLPVPNKGRPKIVKTNLKEVTKSAIGGVTTGNRGSRVAKRRSSGVTKAAKNIKKAVQRAGTSPQFPKTNSIATLQQSKTTNKLLNEKFFENVFNFKEPFNGFSKSTVTSEKNPLAVKYIPLSHSRPLVNELNSPLTISISKKFGLEKNSNKNPGNKSVRANLPRKFRDEEEKARHDDVNEQSESESDETYISQPFYINGDQGMTKQSQHIKYETNKENANPAKVNEDGSENSKYFKPKCILSPSLFPNVAPYLNFSSHAEYGPHMPLALHKVLKWKYSPYMPRIVKKVILNSGFRIIKNTTDWMAIWERHMKSPGFRSIRAYQKYNHMPGSFRIGRKDSMWRSIQNNVRKYGVKEFGFMQKTYIMPEDSEMLRQAWPKNAAKLTKWIVKPPASARGTGIRIINKWSQFPKDRPLIVQKYIERPFLINDNKFDMRIYVILTSVNPLRIYMFKDGLARFASIKYTSELTSLDEKYIHLTNYSVNKFSQNYLRNEDFNACQGHKWTLQSLWSCLEGQGINTKRLWATLRNLVIKAIVTGESGLNMTYQHYVNYRYNCFELFGFDILLDENLIPWLLEINISPSLHSEMPIDLHIKGVLIQSVLNTALFQVPPKLSDIQQKQILNDLRLEGPLCFDERIFTTTLSVEEKRKHTYFTNRSLDSRKDYVEKILEHLLPDDVRCLIIAEDEYARSKPLERIFPTPDTHTYLQYFENHRYYNRLLDAWEHKYGHCRKDGLKILRRLCQDGYHLKVSEASHSETKSSLHDIDISHFRQHSRDLHVSGSNGYNNINRRMPATHTPNFKEYYI